MLNGSIENALKTKTCLRNGIVNNAEKIVEKVLEYELEFDDLIFSKLYKTYKSLVYDIYF